MPEEIKPEPAPVTVVNVPTGVKEMPFKTSVQYFDTKTNRMETVSFKDFTDAMYDISKFSLRGYPFARPNTTVDNRRN